MMGWVRNLRFAVRTLSKAPAFTITTLVLIGVGVGAVTTIFSIVDHVMLRPLPYPEAHRLVTVDNGSHSGLIVKALEELNSVEAWAAGYSEDAEFAGESDLEKVAVTVQPGAALALVCCDVRDDAALIDPRPEHVLVDASNLEYVVRGV